MGYDALTIVSELTANAVRHAGMYKTGLLDAAPEPRRARTCSLSLWVGGLRLYVSVHDETDEPPVLRPASGDDENGRGLQLVAALSEGSWGFTHATSRPGKYVWAALQLPAATTKGIVRASTTKEIPKMTTIESAPWGVRRMKPFPDGAVLPATRVVLDAETQIGNWFAEDGARMSEMAKHKRSETSKETTTRTSLDGNSDEGSDQQGDTD